MLITVFTALATVPEVLQRRTFGVGVEVPVSGIPFSSGSTTDAVSTVTWLFVPTVSARFQLGRIGLVPKVGVRRTAWSSGEDDGSATTANVGLQARGYLANAGPLHLVGLAGLGAGLGRTGGASALDGRLEVGGAVEWIPSSRFSLGLEVPVPLLSASRSKLEQTSTSWSVGLGGVSPAVAAHVWL